MSFRAIRLPTEKARIMHVKAKLQRFNNGEVSGDKTMIQMTTSKCWEGASTTPNAKSQEGQGAGQVVSYAVSMEISLLTEKG